ncbi:MAG: hemerythrin domain-containing protein, partial [Betaproteobacteria bacterium]
MAIAVTTICALLTADHRRADALFAAAAQAAQSGDWAACRKQFVAFQVALGQHVSIE